MFSVFETYITAKGDFTSSELKMMRTLSVTRKIRKRQFILQEGDVCRHKTFICKGLLKSYMRKDDGTEYIMKFSPENSWVVDPPSYHKQLPSKYNIDALEDTDIIQWQRADFEKLLAAIPSLKSFSETLINNSNEANMERILMNISYTSEEKYQAFVDSCPDIFQRVPLHMVASFLGVSRETLSRIRHAQLQQVKNNHFIS
jgi:CRP-like cAMP-binding protein